MIFDDKHVLVTGGTGSLGQHMVRRLLGGNDGHPARVTVLSRDEAKQHDLRLALRHERAATDDVIYRDADEVVRFRIGDIRDHRSVKRALEGVDLVVHTAAMKQVPTCEYAPWEAVRTNVEGATVLVEEARSARSVEAVVGVSTDKACLPVNVMGMTKALMERVLIEANLAEGDTRFLCVRYGNVLGSRGSVIPMLQDQLARGGPLTLTDAGMTRFFLTLDAACDTVVAAFEHGRGGEVWVPRIGAARLVDVIDAVRDGADVEVKVIGVRPGEKMHEQLVSEEEAVRSVVVGGYAVIQPLLPEIEGRDAPPLEAAWTSASTDLDRDAVARLLSAAATAARATS